MISQISQCVWFHTKVFYCALLPQPFSNGYFCGAVGMEDWRHTCFSYFAKSKTGSEGETSHKPWSICASVWIFLVDGVWTPLYAPSLSFLSFWIWGYLLLFFLTCLSMWHTFFGYASFFLFFDMPKHVAYLLWVCIFYFLIAPYPWHIFEREWCYTWTWSFILWMDEILLTSSVEA